MTARTVARPRDSTPAGLAAQLVDRLVLFASFARRESSAPSTLPAWGDVTAQAQHARFIGDVPAGQPPVLQASGRHVLYEAVGRALKGAVL